MHIAEMPRGSLWVGTVITFMEHTPGTTNAFTGLSQTITEEWMVPVSCRSAHNKGVGKVPFGESPIAA